jgi:hypothetical protein
MASVNLYSLPLRQSSPSTRERLFFIPSHHFSPRPSSSQSLSHLHPVVDSCPSSTLDSSSSGLAVLGASVLQSRPPAAPLLCLLLVLAPRPSESLSLSACLCLVALLCFGAVFCFALLFLRGVDGQRRPRTCTGLALDFRLSPRATLATLHPIHPRKFSLASLIIDFKTHNGRQTPSESSEGEEANKGRG